MAADDREAVRTHVPRAFVLDDEEEVQRLAAALRRDANTMWAHPAHWAAWEAVVRKCDLETLRSFMQDISSARIMDVWHFDWLRPLSGVVSCKGDVVTLQYDSYQPFSPDPSKRTMCLCRQCPDCGAVWKSPHEFRVCGDCETMYLPHQPPRRRCICQCRYTQTLPELLDDIRWGDIRIPQLCHYLFGKQEKHTSCASKAKARARARARAQGGGSAKRNKALKVKN